MKRILFIFLLLLIMPFASFSFDKPEIFLQLGHSKDVTSVFFSPDGKYIASGSRDKTVKLWEVSSGKNIRTFIGHSDYIYSVAFSPDGKYIASGSHDTTIKLWEVSSGKNIRTFIGHSGNVSSIAFSPDGKYIASGSGDKTIKLWEVSSGKNIRTFIGHSDYISSIAFSPDGKYIASGCQDSTIKIWEISSGKQMRIFIGHSYHVSSVAFSPDGRFIASGSLDETVKLWEVSSGMEIRTFKGHSWVKSVAFSPDGRFIASGSGDKTIKLWEVSSGKNIRTFKGHSGDVSSVAFSPDGRYIASGSMDNTVKLWEVSSGKRINIFKGNSIFVTSVVFSPDGNYIASGGDDNTVKLWEVSSGKNIRIFKGHNKYVTSLAFFPDGRYLASGSEDNTVKLWEVSSGKNIRTFKDNGVRGKTEYIIIEVSSEREKIFEGRNRGVTSIAFSPDGRYIASGSHDTTIKLWEVSSGKKMKTFKGHSSWITSVAFSPDGRYLASGSEDNTVKLWEINSEKVKNGINYINLFAILFSDLNIEKEIKTFKEHSKGVTSIAFSPDGKYIISGSKDNTVKLWEVSSGKEIMTLIGHSGWVTSVAFSPDGRYIASGSDDGTIRLWDIPYDREVAMFASFTDGEWVVITPEGYYNASPNGEKYLNVRVGNNVYSIENYREAFYRPDLVKLALAGHSLKDYKTIAEVKQPPVVEIIDTPKEVNTDEVKVTVRLTDIGGGIGDIRLYLNESAILLDSARGLRITPKPGEKTVYKTYTVKLLSGENTIKAIAFNEDNSMASNPALHRVVSLAKAIKKPSMYAVVIGINEYKNPKLTLKYAVSDARLFAEALKQVGKPLFERVEIRLLTKQEETTKESIKKALEGLKKLSPDDVFVFYVASHGIIDEGEYFLLTSNVGSLSTFRLKEDALRQTELKELIANIPSTKKLIVIDTCHAGKLGEALQVAMLTRGMSEETAMKILSRAVGSTIISASTDYQEALEGYQGHGLFTYVLVEGLRGKADMDRDGFIKTLELANYVDSQVPVLAEKVFKRAQYPTATPTGQSFPVGRVR
ncbi:MAG: caspase family protein [Thermodesulfovibrio sp.]|nr:caspase family protein [Thermodesulfovibrio sp.]